MTPLVVTGANGFVGRALLARCAATPDFGPIRALVRRPDELTGVTGIEPVAFDALHPESAATQVGGAVVVHLAAYIPPDHSDPAHAPQCQRINAQAVLDLLDVCERAGARRFVHVSSANAYKPGADRGQAVDEEAPVFPTRRAPFYLASKLVGEVYAEHYRHRGLPGCTLRLSSVYGPGMRGGAVYELARRLRAGEAVRLDDGGRFASDLVWIGDVARALMAAAGSETVDGTINVGSGERSTVLEVAWTIASIRALDRSLIEVAPARTGPEEGFPALDVTRARTLLDHRPTPLTDGLTAYLEYLDAAEPLG